MAEFLTALGLTLTLANQGAAAYMPAENFTGNVLYCDGRSSPAGTLYYSADIAWATMPIRDFQSGAVECGDLAVVTFEDGRVLFLPVLDASMLHVKDSYLGVPFVVELPEHVNDRTERVEVSVWSRSAFGP